MSQNIENAMLSNYLPVVKSITWTKYIFLSTYFVVHIFATLEINVCYSLSYLIINTYIMVSIN